MRRLGRVTGISIAAFRSAAVRCIPPRFGRTAGAHVTSCHSKGLGTALWKTHVSESWTQKSPAGCKTAVLSVPGGGSNKKKKEEEKMQGIVYDGPSNQVNTAT